MKTSNKKSHKRKSRSRSPSKATSKSDGDIDKKKPKASPSNSDKDDKKSLLNAIRHQDPSVFQCASAQLRDDPEVLLEAISKDGMMLQYASDRLQDDCDMVLAAAQNATSAVFQLASERLRDDKALVLALLKLDWKALMYVSPRLQNDPDVALEAVTQNGRALKYLCNNNLTKDSITKEIVLQAVKNCGTSIHYAPDHFWDDQQVVRQAVSGKQCGWMLQQASSRLCNDKEVVLAAISNGDVFDLQYASVELQADPEILQAARTSALEAFSGGADTQRFHQLVPPLQDDVDIVQAALESPYFSPIMLSHVSERLQEDPSIFQKALDRQKQQSSSSSVALPGEHVLDFAPLAIRLELEIEELRLDPTRFRRLPEELSHNREFVLAAVKANAKIFPFLSWRFRDDVAIFRQAMEQNKDDEDACHVMETAGESLKANRAIGLLVVQKSGLAIKHLAPSLRGDRAIALAAVQQTGVALEFVADSLQADPEIARAAAHKCLGAIPFVNCNKLKGSLENDPIMVAHAISSVDHYSVVWPFVGATLQTRFASAVLAFQKHLLKKKGSDHDNDEIKLTLPNLERIQQLAKNIVKDNKKGAADQEQQQQAGEDVLHCAPLLAAFANTKSCWNDDVGMRWNQLPS